MIGHLDPVADQHLRDLIIESGMPLKIFSLASGISNSEVMKWWSGSGKQLNSKNLSSLSQFFGVSEELLLGKQAQLPIDLIRNRMFGGPKALPERYAHNASSFIRSSAHIIEYLSLIKGRSFTDHLLVGMNVHPLIFDDLDNRINLQFLIDLLNKLALSGMDQDEIESLGCFIFLRIRETPLGRQFAGAKDYRECYEVLAKNIATFDTNFSYRMEVDSREMRLYARPSEAEIFLAEHPQIFELVALQKKKMVGWFPILSQLPPVQIDMPKCVSRGDPFCLYRFQFANSPPAQPNYLRLLGSA